MFYKPNFCAECGEKIERIEWQPWTSRRFCDDCAAQHENSIRWKTGIGVVCLLLVGIFAGQIRFTTPKQNAVVNAQALVSSSPNLSSSNQISKNSNQPLPPSANAVVQTSQNKTLINPPPIVAAQIEIAYYCGAKTQKGTICTRRVKGAHRCWQHTGKSPMVAQEKLLIQTEGRQ